MTRKSYFLEDSMTGEDMWQLINLSTVHSTPIVGFGVPIFSENGKTLIRLPLGVALKMKCMI